MLVTLMVVTGIVVTEPQSNNEPTTEENKGKKDCDMYHWVFQYAIEDTNQMKLLSFVS